KLFRTSGLLLVNLTRDIDTPDRSSPIQDDWRGSKVTNATQPPSFPLNAFLVVEPIGNLTDDRSACQSFAISRSICLKA
ncbi:MAG TPA: hypothetical protein DCS91_05695, partial [Microcoleaceae bacterium UBA11344]|nr:hypothetical protein [Microcoleaceae cyanobacterium UBA11344]